jgi:hypothetical protein
MATQPMFKFELGWLLRERFMDKVRDIWRHVVGCCTTMEIWQRKIRMLRQYLRDWAKKHNWEIQDGQKGDTKYIGYVR